MLVFVLNQIQKANTGKIQTPVYENVREFGQEAQLLVSDGFHRNSLSDLTKTEKSGNVSPHPIRNTPDFSGVSTMENRIN